MIVSTLLSKFLSTAFQRVYFDGAEKRDRQWLKRDRRPNQFSGESAVQVPKKRLSYTEKLDANVRATRTSVRAKARTRLRDDYGER